MTVLPATTRVTWADFMRATVDAEAIDGEIAARKRWADAAEKAGDQDTARMCRSMIGALQDRLADHDHVKGFKGLDSSHTAYARVCDGWEQWAVRRGDEAGAAVARYWAERARGWRARLDPDDARREAPEGDLNGGDGCPGSSAAPASRTGRHEPRNDLRRTSRELPHLCLGIDPGLDGVLVALDEDLEVVAVYVMPTLGKGRRVLDLVFLRRVLMELDEAHRLRVVLEKSGTRPTDGKASAWKTGCGWGQLDGLLCGLSIPYEVVPPQTWQAAVCRGLPAMDTKDRTVLAVSRRIPALDLTPGRRTKPHTGLADGAGLALWGWLTRRGEM